jgi:uncharacterized protein YndB with AHSA1/START domain
MLGRGLTWWCAPAIAGVASWAMGGWEVPKSKDRGKLRPMASSDVVSAERIIAAEPQAIFDVLADPAKHCVIDGSGTVQSSRTQQRLTLGHSFGMSMRNRLSYKTNPVVTEFEEGRVVAWRNKGGPTWRYELFPSDGGTRVVETYDLNTMRAGSLMKLTGLAKRTQQNMVNTLERLDRVVTSDTAGPGA